MTDTFNLAAYSRTAEPGSIPLVYGFNARPHVNFSGSKIVARFAQLLLTRRGSDITDPDAGCWLLDILNDVHTSERAFIREHINNALEDVAFQMHFENDSAVPTDAQFADARCDAVDFIEDTIVAYFTLITRANTSLKFQIPLKV